MNGHRPRQPPPSPSSPTHPGGVDHRAASVAVSSSPTSLLVCTIALVGLALLIQSDSPVIPAAIRTGSRLWKSAASAGAAALADDDDDSQSLSSSPGAGSVNGRRQSSSQQPSSSKRGGRKQQKRKSNREARAAEAAATASSNSTAVASSSSISSGVIPITSVTAHQPSIPIVQAPVPPLHKSLRAQQQPVKNSKPPQSATTSKKRVSPSAHPTKQPRQSQVQVQVPSRAPQLVNPSSATPPSHPNASRGLSCSEILQSLLNPRAAVYEFRAQYHQDPLSALTTTATDAPLAAPQLITAATEAPTASPYSQQAPSLPVFVPYPTASAYTSPTNEVYDTILVLDVEATCASGSTFDYPNEIIEWPVLLMKWVDEETPLGSTERKLVVVDDFRSYVRPTWRPQLTDFCKSLTGIDQAEIDSAPTFVEMLASFEAWLQKHGLIPPPTALLTPPSSRCSSPVPAVKQPHHLHSLSPHMPPLIEFPPLLPSVEDSPSSTASLSFSSSNGSSYASSCSSASSLATFSPASSYAAMLSPRPRPSVIQEDYAYDAASAAADWDSYGYGSAAPQHDHEYSGPRFAWATDGPCDLRDFLVKQCFISQIPIPEYFLGDVIDVRRVVGTWVDADPLTAPTKANSAVGRPAHMRHGKRQSLNIPSQLQALSLGSFLGHQHRGIDDARNISRIVQALAAKSVPLEANMYVNPNRRWFWMGSGGQVVLPPSSAVAQVVPSL